MLIILLFQSGNKFQYNGRGKPLVIPPSATIAGSSASNKYFDDVREMNTKNTLSENKFQDLKGTAQCSVLHNIV